MASKLARILAKPLDRCYLCYLLFHGISVPRISPGSRSFDDEYPGDSTSETFDPGSGSQRVFGVDGESGMWHAFQGADMAGRVDPG